jgi:hypothetical protein
MTEIVREMKLMKEIEKPKMKEIGKWKLRKIEKKKKTNSEMRKPSWIMTRSKSKKQ